METIRFTELDSHFDALAHSSHLTPIQKAFVAELGREFRKVVVMWHYAPAIRATAYSSLFSATQYLAHVRPIICGVAGHVRAESFQSTADYRPAIRDHADRLRTAITPSSFSISCIATSY